MGRVRACVHAFVRACVRACVQVYMIYYAHTWMKLIKTIDKITKNYHNSA